MRLCIKVLMACLVLCNPKKNSNGHYNATESRELLRMIKLYEDMEYVLKSTPLAFKLEEKYDNMLKFLQWFFCKKDGGNEILMICRNLI